ncbi:MAG: (d)CMP kinase [Lachnospiraceae bacterium]|nr:(d)CMP kinase [Lachnospiraceae bacterium]MDD6858064.1 (d)CMP kinase [Lachnospiraceae bacterium]
MNIAIDGPAGAGKSTIAKKVASDIGYVYVDTGAIYRTLALACIRKGIAADDEKNVCDICKNTKVDIKYVDGEQIMLLDGENVNAYIRSEDVSRMTSSISVYKEVREQLIDLQRYIAEKENVIMDGRDIGTFVLPNAEVKIYLNASVETRAKRRYLEQKDKGVECSLEDIEKDIKERDYRDMHRDIAPLRKADDAVEVDTSSMTIDEVVMKIKDIIKEKAE